MDKAGGSAANTPPGRIRLSGGDSRGVLRGRPLQHGDLRLKVAALKVDVVGRFQVRAVARDGAEGFDAALHAGNLLLLFGGQGLHFGSSFRELNS